MSTANEMVWCVSCVTHDGYDHVHVFSTPEKRQAWVNADEHNYRVYVHYDYVIDQPELLYRKPKMDQ